MIRCGHCIQAGRLLCYHDTVVQVRVCGTGVYVDPDTGERHEGAVLCDWLMQRWVEDGYITFECAAPAWQTEHGSRCAAGHEHTSLEACERLGIVYATDDGEAEHLYKAGKTVLLMDGSNYVPA